MLLSIVIPTRNRAAYLGLLINSLRNLLAGVDLEWEILVSNNHSKDSTVELAKKIGIVEPRLRVVEPPSPLDTAEENLAFGIMQARGEYVWLLGDDDIPEPAGFSAMIGVIKRKKYDFIVFNSIGIDNSGDVFSSQKVPCLLDRWETTIDRFIVHQGFMYTLSGFSTTVLRRTAFDYAVFEEYLRVSPIYSHVTSFVDCYAGRPMLFVNLPLVRYRRNRYAEGERGHWESYASRVGRFEKFFWTVGLARQLERLVSRGKIGYEHLYYSIEQSDFGRPRLLHCMLGALSQQLALEVGRRRVKHPISSEEILEFRDFLGRVAPMEWGVLNVLGALAEVLPGGKNPVAAKAHAIRFAEIVYDLSSKSLAEQFFLTISAGRPVYRHAWLTFTVKQEACKDRMIDAGNILWYIDYADSPFVEIVESFAQEAGRISSANDGAELVSPITTCLYVDRKPLRGAARILLGESRIGGIFRKIGEKIRRKSRAMVKRLLT